MGAAIGWFALQGPVDHLRHRVVRIGARPAGSELIVQALQTQFSVALAPLTDGHARQAHALGDRRVGFASTTARCKP